MVMAKRDFLTLLDFTGQELEQLLQRAIELKAMQKAGIAHTPLRNRVLVMVFEKSSTRTRVSFEAGMTKLGGHAIFLSPADSQLGRGEDLEDTARVLSRMADGILVRTYSHGGLQRFAAASSVPVINGLTDSFHPCQLLADMMTYIERRGSIAKRTVAFIGDGNNMCHSYVNAAIRLGFELRIACPQDYAPDPAITATAGTAVACLRDPKEAVAGADLVVTDVWTSMGQEREAARRKQVFRPYQVNTELMQLAQPDALFMHCLPAHRGEEVTAQVIDGPWSAVWDEAENRLHAQKALLEKLLG